MTPFTYLWVGLGGALGSMARLGLGALVSHSFGDGFPLGTLLINILGSFVITFFSTLALDQGWLRQTPLNARAFVTTGICGGFTTFSSFSLQTLALARSGEVTAAAVYVGLSVVLCLLAAWLGIAAGAALNAMMKA